MRRTGLAVLLCAWLAAALAGCGAEEEVQVEGVIVLQSEGKEEAQGESSSGLQSEGKEEVQGESSSGPQSEGKEEAQEEDGSDPRGERIEEQSFTVNLEPLGEVTFASYLPDTGENSLEDAVFLIEKEGEILLQLPGVYEDNCREQETFSRVEAVSFPDYNGDGCTDAIIICMYLPLSEGGEEYAEIRYYTGNSQGTFTYEAQMSQDANAALAVKTIESAKGFIGAG